MQVAIVDGTPVVTGVVEGRTTETSIWAAMNSKSRVDAREHAKYKVQTEALIVAVVAAPLMQLNDRLLKVESEK